MGWSDGLCARALALVATLGLFTVGAASATSLAAPDPDPEAVTFTGDVATIIQQNCQVCHQPGGIGPMSFTTYDEVRPWASIIKLRVQTREMPPYHYDTEVGIQDLQNDWRLSEEEIRTIAAWVDAGAPQGDPVNMPTPPTFADGRSFRMEAKFGRAPDVVISSTPYDVPGSGSDRWWRPVVPSGITESRCIAAVETKPSFESRTVAHHANTSFRGGTIDSAATDDDADAPAAQRGGQLSEYAMGKIGEIIPADACRRAPANGEVSFDIHYYPNGEGVEDATVDVGIWFLSEDEEPKYRQNLSLYGTQSGSGDLEIPPHGTLMTEGMTVWDYPVRIDSWQPHGHLRLVGAKLEVLDPKTGRKTLLSMVSNWNAGWHHSHVYEEDAAPLIPAGHILVRTQWYDNTEDNVYMKRLGGSPDMWVGTGDRTGDEMSHQWIAVTHLDEEGYQALLAERGQSAPEESEISPNRPGAN
ncbi:MAG: cytochrome c [Gemmatimonadota bacterium]